MRKTISQRAENISNRDVLLILSGFALGTSAGSLATHQMLDGGGTFLAWLNSWLQNVSTEMFGGFVTFVLIEVLIVSRREREAREREAMRKEAERLRGIEEQKRTLIRQMGSTLNDRAVQAVEDLRAHGWIEDGSLRGAKLSRAHLARAPLQRADLEDAQLFGTELQGASLYQASLVNARMAAADLRRAKLGRADLRGASMEGVNMAGASGVGHRQLRVALRLKGATMTDGARYDGRYNLLGDARHARKQGHDHESPMSMAEYYGVALEVYLHGQAQEQKQASGTRSSKSVGNEEGGGKTESDREQEQDDQDP